MASINFILNECYNNIKLSIKELGFSSPSGFGCRLFRVPRNPIRLRAPLKVHSHDATTTAIAIDSSKKLH